MTRERAVREALERLEANIAASMSKQLMADVALLRTTLAATPEPEARDIDCEDCQEMAGRLLKIVAYCMGRDVPSPAVVIGLATAKIEEPPPPQPPAAVRERVELRVQRRPDGRPNTEPAAMLCLRDVDDFGRRRTRFVATVAPEYIEALDAALRAAQGGE